MRPGDGSTHGVEFGGVWILVEAERLAGLACMIVFDVMAVGETIRHFGENRTWQMTCNYVDLPLNAGPPKLSRLFCPDK